MAATAEAEEVTMKGETNNSTTAPQPIDADELMVTVLNPVASSPPPSPLVRAGGSSHTMSVYGVAMPMAGLAAKQDATPSTGHMLTNWLTCTLFLFLPAHFTAILLFSYTHCLSIS